MMNTYLLFENITGGPGPYNVSNYTFEILALLLLATLLGYLLRYFLTRGKYSSLEKNFDLQKQQIMSLENDISTSKKQYSEIDSKYNLSMASHKEFEDEISILKSRIRYKDDEISKFKSDAIEIQNIKDNYDTKINILTKQISDNKKIIADLKKSKGGSLSIKPKAASKSIVTKKAPTKKTVTKKVSVKKSPTVKVHPLSKYKETDLKIIEGIGPKIESLLHNAGITNWKELEKTSIEKIQSVLNAAGPRYKLAVPNTWPNQAKLAAAKEWKQLQEYQDFLEGGKDFT